MSIHTRIIVHHDKDHEVAVRDDDNELAIVSGWPQRLRKVSELFEPTIEVQQLAIMPPARAGQQVEILWNSDDEPFCADLLGWLIDVSPDCQLRNPPCPIVAADADGQDAMGVLDHSSIKWRIVDGAR